MSPRVDVIVLSTNVRNRSSATNVASMYNRTLSKRWSTTEQEGSVSYRSVLECFFLYSLVLDSKTQNRPLVLPHNIPQQHRLMLALDERNARVASNGLVHWPHKCNECFQTVRDDQNGEECECAGNIHPCTGGNFSRGLQTPFQLW